MRDLDDVLQRLAGTFTVKDIMIPFPSERLVFASGETAARVLLEEHPEFDTIPVERGGMLQAYLERGAPSIKGISLSDATSDSTSILDLVDALTDRKFLFVLMSTKIGGYVHFSDLNNRLVKVPYFLMLEALEHRFTDELAGLITEGVLEQILDPKSLDYARSRMQRLRKRGAELNWAALLSFDQIMKCSCFLDKAQLAPEQVQDLSATRNAVSHTQRTLVTHHEDVRRLAQVKAICLSLLPRSIG